MRPSSTHSGDDAEPSNLPAMLRHLVRGPKPDIQITLDSDRHTFSTLDTLRGHVSITAPVDVNFDDIEIEFAGTSRTYVERLSAATQANSRTEAFHLHLKLVQPGVSRRYPEDKILKAGQTYAFPYIFAVPAQLLPRVCQHAVSHPGVRDAHLLLPPSFGDRETGSKHEDDLAPQSASIRYGIVARILNYKFEDGKITRSVVATRTRRVHVIPAVEEQPPLNIEPGDQDYVMRREKKVKKNIFKGRLGTLVMETQQPKALQLPPVNEVSDSRVSTMATIMLRFDPHEENAQPPQLNKLSSRLRVSTFFSSVARADFPSKTDPSLHVTSGLNNDILDLSSRCVGNVEWEKMDSRSPRRESATSVMSLTNQGVTPEPSEHFIGGTFYVARILVPIDLPTKKTFVPSFHTCLVSRFYSIHFHLSCHTAGLGGSMDLKVPIQISSSPSITDGLENQRSRGSVASTVGVDRDEQGEDLPDFAEPRIIRAPSDAFVGRSRIGSVVVGTPSRGSGGDEPPSYAHAASGSGSIIARSPMEKTSGPQAIAAA